MSCFANVHLQEGGLIPVRGLSEDGLGRIFVEICPVLGSVDDIIHARFFLELGGQSVWANLTLRDQWLAQSEMFEGPSRALMVSLPGLQMDSTCLLCDARTPQDEACSEAQSAMNSMDVREWSAAHCNWPL